MDSKKIFSLQALRGLAALSVVAHHSFRAVTVNAPTYLNPPEALLLSNVTLVEIGAFGVDIFFILSGFLMVYISDPYLSGKKNIPDFVIQRLIRVWPLYILATASFLSLLVVSQMIKGGPPPFDLSLVRLLSFFFIPSFNESGILQPILGVGWTLNYEIFFYLVFSLALVTRGNLPLLLGGYLLAFFALGKMFPEGAVPAVFLSDPIIFEFLFGALIGWLYKNGKVPALHPALYLIAGVTILISFAGIPNESHYRFIVRGVPSALIFVGVLLLEKKISWNRWLLLLGDASYSIYLFHIVFVYQVANRLFPFLLGKGMTVMAAEITALVTVIVCVAIGVSIHLLVERPIIRTLNRTYKRRSQAA